ADPKYDLIVDIAGSKSALACRRSLNREGSCVVVGGPAGRWLQPAGDMMAAMAVAPFVTQRIVGTDVVRCQRNRQNLADLMALIAAGDVRAVIDRVYPFDEI